MNKVIVFPVDTIVNAETNELYEDILLMIEKLNQDNNVIVFSRRVERLSIAKSLLEDRCSYFTREKFKNVLDEKKKTENLSKTFVIVSCKDVDMQLAATNKLLFINPTWVIEQEHNALKYGLPVRNPLGLVKVIEIINNQITWFYKLQVSPKTTILSLTSANYYGKGHSDEEVEILKGFEFFLKNGDYSYYQVLLFHFLAGIANSDEFAEIQDWGIIPSSKVDLNQEMWDFKEKARYLKNGRKKEPMFIRHTAVLKSREMDYSVRLPCDRHFESIILNPYYKGKLKNRSVCILDDYLTNGTMFETVRNMLESEGVKQILLVSLGRFHRNNSNGDYLKQIYNLKGDLCVPGKCIYTLQQKERLFGNFNRQAIKEIENLYSILYNA